jgi:hypothetical protein
MSANSIIKKFNINEDVSTLENSSSLYFKLTLDTEEIKRKNVVFCKICVNRKTDIDGIEYNGFDGIQNNFLNKNKPDYLRQYAYEYHPVAMDFLGEEVYREYLFGLPLNTINQILEDNEGNEVDHIFTIYFLNNNKNIIEFYSYQADNKRIEDYSAIDISLSSKADFLEDNIDFIIRDYNDTLANDPLGPVIQVSDLFENFPGNEDCKSNITLKITFKDYSYNYTHIFDDSFSIKLIENYRTGIVFDLYNDLLLIDEASKTIILEYEYLDDVVFVEKLVTKNQILSLYSSHYKKHKVSFVRDTFFENIDIIINDNKPDSISLDTCNLKYLADFDISLSNFKIKKGNLFVEKLFTLINLDDDSAISSTNKLFSYSSIFGEEKKIYYIKKNATEDVTYTLYYDNIEIKQNVSAEQALPEDENNLNDSISNSQNFSNILTNPRINGKRIIAEFNMALVYENKNPLAHLNFNIENNDYLASEVLEDTVLKLNVNYFNRKNEKINAVIFDKATNLINKDLKTLSTNFKSSVSEFNSSVEMEVKSFTLPKNTLSKIFSFESNNINEKENIAKFLNEVSSNRFHDIINLIDNNLFKKQTTIGKQKVYEDLFNVCDQIKSVKRIVKNEASEVDVISSVSTNVVREKNTNLYNINSRLRNISDATTHQNLVDFKSLVGVKNRSIILSSNQKNNIVASVYLDRILKDNLNIQDLSFNVKRLITYEFFIKDWKANKYKTTSKRYFNEKEMQLITNNMPYTISGNNLFISNKETNLLVSKDVYTSLYECWGNKNNLYINNVIERFCIIIKKKNSGDTIDVLFFNNRVKQDILSSKNYISNTNLLGDNLHKPNIVLQYH